MSCNLKVDHGHEKIFVTKLSPAKRASLAHVISP